MSKQECGIERDPKPRYTIAIRSRWRDEWEVWLFDDYDSATKRYYEAAKQGRGVRMMLESLYPACDLPSEYNAEPCLSWHPGADPRGVLFESMPKERPARVPTMAVPISYNDGGRASAGYKGSAGDCVVRAIAIAAERPYQEVYDALFALRIHHAATRRDRTARSIKRKGNSPRNGNPRKVYEAYLKELGWRFVPTMSFGSGCKVHLRPDELPAGRIIARVSRHLVAMIDGVIHDTFDCSRGGTRCVYGYYINSVGAGQVSATTQGQPATRPTP